MASSGSQEDESDRVSRGAHPTAAGLRTARTGGSSDGAKSPVARSIAGLEVVLGGRRARRECLDPRFKLLIRRRQALSVLAQVLFPRIHHEELGEPTRRLRVAEESPLDSTCAQSTASHQLHVRDESLFVPADTVYVTVTIKPLAVGFDSLSAHRFFLRSDDFGLSPERDDLRRAIGFGRAERSFTH